MGIVSTDFTVKLTVPDGTSATIKIHINNLNPAPGSDSWTGNPADFEIGGGGVSGWNTGDAHLSGPAGTDSIILTGFGTKTAVNDQNSGKKNYQGGSLPASDLVWMCTKKE